VATGVASASPSSTTFQRSSSAATARDSSRYIIAGAVICAALLRIAWAMRYAKSLEGEGVEYTRIAENLLAGRGYVGIFANGTQLNFPPLYPVLIAAVSLVVPSPEFAARAINIFFGAALVIPVFKIADELYGRRAAIIAAIVVTLHPVLLVGSTTTFSEVSYLTLLLSAVFWITRWITTQRMRCAALAGVFFGLGYLVRPEAFLLAGEFTVLGLVAVLMSKERRALTRGVAALPLAFAIIASPNIIFLTKATGKLRIEAKGTLAYEWGRRINEGMPYQEAVKGIGEDLSEQGVFMRPNRDVINGASYTFRQVSRLRAPRRSAQRRDHRSNDRRRQGARLAVAVRPDCPGPVSYWLDARAFAPRRHTGRRRGHGGRRSGHGAGDLVSLLFLPARILRDLDEQRRVRRWGLGGDDGRIAQSKPAQARAHSRCGDSILAGLGSRTRVVGNP
jgi:hypothetical protein